MTSIWHAGWSTQALGAELAGLSGQTWTLASLLGGAIALIFLGWLVPYRLVRRKDYEEVLALLKGAQATIAANAETMKASAAKKDLVTAIVEEMRKEGHHQRGVAQEEQP